MGTIRGRQRIESVSQAMFLTILPSGAPTEKTMQQGAGLFTWPLFHIATNLESVSQAMCLTVQPMGLTQADMEQGAWLYRWQTSVRYLFDESLRPIVFLLPQSHEDAPMVIVTKYPNEVFPIAFNFVQRLALPGMRIKSGTVSAVDKNAADATSVVLTSSQLVISTSSLTNQYLAIATVKGGVASGTPYTLSYVVTLTNGYILREDATLTIL